VTRSADAMELKPGSRWRSAVCDTEIVVVRAPGTPVTLRIGGTGVLQGQARRPPGPGPDAALADGTLLGKRYTDEDSGLEVMCTKPGRGTITVDGRRATIRKPRQLPASD
jgi:hypothetical protein